MDNLKYINDNFGHASEIVLLKAVDALMYSSEDDEICIRMGGMSFLCRVE